MHGASALGIFHAPLIARRYQMLSGVTACFWAEHSVGAFQTDEPGRQTAQYDMSQELLSFFLNVGQTFMKGVPISIGLAVVFTVLTWLSACNPGRAWWQKRDLVTDLCYWFFIPVVTRYLRIGMLIVGAAALFRITSAEGLVAFYDNGHGPLAALPMPVQMILFLVGEDIILYWTHRWFHGMRMWKYHAVHHSSEELEWISAARFHPVDLFLHGVLADVVMLLAGISPNVLVVLGPLTIAHSAFVHANLDWTLGPFKYLIATPVFHRWHHTAADRGGEKNFAATFPMLDLLFGTFYMPAGELPDRYGIDDRTFPTSFPRQLAHPFTQ
jgi:sterol desaturase/sphingolipid hydroxylase (fatty acid hydroxylase superfamily)